MSFSSFSSNSFWDMWEWGRAMSWGEVWCCLSVQSGARGNASPLVMSNFTFLNTSILSLLVVLRKLNSFSLVKKGLHHTKVAEHGGIISLLLSDAIIPFVLYWGWTAKPREVRTACSKKVFPILLLNIALAVCCFGTPLSTPCCNLGLNSQLTKEVGLACKSGQKSSFFLFLDWNCWT